MLEINFYSKENNNDLVQAVREYQQVWDTEGENITNVIQKNAGLNFEESKIKAIIHEAMSTSHPLQLRASYPVDIKKATLIHELCHILLSDNNIKIEDAKQISLEVHKLIFLILYDIWLELYGKKFAEDMVEVESKRNEIYEKAWNWALSFSKEDRSKQFFKLIK